MKKTIILLLLLIVFGSLAAQESGTDYKIIPVHKKIKELTGNNPYESALSNYAARIHSLVSGKNWPISAEMLCNTASAPPRISLEYANELLDADIEEVIVYKDSVSGVIRREPNNNILVIGWCVLENGQWKAMGEGVCFTGDLADARQQIVEHTQRLLPSLRKYYEQSVVSSDTAAFVNYLQQKGSDPKAWLLDKLSTHKLVIYGETHRRKVSWDFLKTVIKDTAFYGVCNTVFMELPVHTQSLIDTFLRLDTLNTDIVLDILGSEQLYGWSDKGMYEFIVEAWRVNHQTKNSIQIKAVDFQIPFDSLKTHQEYKYHNRQDRDSTMANVVETILRTKKDTGNCLFIVGSNHARKSSPNNPKKAGTLLAERFPKSFVFSIMTHSMTGDNVDFCGQIRYGLYDYLFESNGNIPVAFDLSDSPFGKEPFDALQQVRYEPSCGNYEDFYDGYIFLGPLQNEEYDYTLFELFTDKFIEKLKQRALVTTSNNAWYDISVKDVTKEKIIEKIKEEQRCQHNKYFNKCVKN